MANPISITVYPTENFALPALVENTSQQLLTQSNISFISRVITDRATGTILSTTALNVGTCIFNTPQTGNGWTGTVGYNFFDNLSIATVGKYAVAYLFTDSLSIVQAIGVVNVQVIPLAAPV